MEVDLFIISYGQTGVLFVSCRHTSFKKKITPSKTTVHSYQVQGHTSFLVLFCIKCCSVWGHFSSSNQLAMSLRNCEQNLGKHDLIHKVIRYK